MSEKLTYDDVIEARHEIEKMGYEVSALEVSETCKDDILTDSSYLSAGAVGNLMEHVVGIRILVDPIATGRTARLVGVSRNGARKTSVTLR